MLVSTKPQLRLDERMAIHLEVVARKAAGESLSEMARKAGVSQPAVTKIFRGPDVGADVARQLVERAFRTTIDVLVDKHRIRITAGDIVLTLRRYEALAETILEDSGRWSAARLIEVVSEAKHSPPLADPRGQLTRGTWRDVLDGATGDKVGGVERFRAHRRTPGGV